MMRRLALASLVSLTACAPVRFADRAILWREHDDRSIPQPKPAEVGIHWMGLRDVVFVPADRVLQLDYGKEAENVNALDEVPDSSWFHDLRRSAADPARPRPLGFDGLYRGVVGDEDLPVPPFRVVKGKTNGATKGFVVVDARHVQYMVKLDPPGRPGLATSVEVVVSRLAAAFGWRVPAEVMARVQPEELVVAPGTTAKDQWNHKVPFTDDDLRSFLSDVPRLPDGSIQMLMSRWLRGVALGSFAWFGRRSDDPNDRVAHENRREVRGFGTFAAWVNDIDTFENNTLDMYVDGHVVHYQQDVGGAFGVWAFTPAAYWMGHETYFSPSRILWSLLTLGLFPSAWEGDDVRAEYARKDARSRELGAFDADGFDPTRWHPVLENPAFERQTRRDRYWAAKRIAAIGADELRGAIHAGDYPPAVERRLFDILWRRREKVLRAFLVASTPLDYFRVDGERLCFDDLWHQAGLGGAGDPVAREGGRRLATAPPLDDQTCVALPPARGYRIVELTAPRPGERTPPPVRVHVVDRPGGHAVIGVER